MVLASLHGNRRTSTSEVSLRRSIVACVYTHRKNTKMTDVPEQRHKDLNLTKDFEKLVGLGTTGRVGWADKAQGIPFRPKPILTISGGFANYVADSNSVFVVANFFFERFDFLVCSKFNRMQRDCTCACAVASLHPHNSIS